MCSNDSCLQPAAVAARRWAFRSTHIPSWEAKCERHAGLQCAASARRGFAGDGPRSRGLLPLRTALRQHAHSLRRERFCCHGCATVHGLLNASGLGRSHELNAHPGSKINSPAAREQWAFLDAPEVQGPLLDFTGG